MDRCVKVLDIQFSTVSITISSRSVLQKNETTKRNRDDSISTQLDPDGHIVKMSGRLPDLDSVISRPASAAAKPTDRTKSVAVLESFPSYRLHWTSLRECLKVLFPAYDFGDVHEIESDGRYHFSVPRLLTSVS